MSVEERTLEASQAPDSRGKNYKWIALSNTTLGILMVTINQSILLISLPDLFRGLNLNPLVPANTSYFLWVFMGFMLVTAVLVVSLGRVGDIYGRVRMYNLGFAVFTLFSILLSVTFMQGTGGALWIIIMRIFQGVGGALLFANSTAILTDAFPVDERGKAMGINGIAAVGGSFLGLMLGGVLGPIEWRLVFLVSVPFGLFGTVWAYLKLKDNGVRIPAKIDWLGNVLFAVGLIAVLTGIVYSLLPYGGSPTGWTNPWVLTGIFGGIAVLVLFGWVETKVAAPMFRLGLFKIRAFTFGNIAGLLGALGRGGIQFMLIIWLQGIWLPQHGYSFSQTPLWAGISMIPLTLGFLIVGPLAGWLSDKHGARLFATTGLIVSGAAFLLLETLPINFSYVWFALLIFLFAVGMGLFFSPNQAGVMNSLPPEQRGAGAGHAQHLPELRDGAVDGPVLHHRHPGPRRAAPLASVQGPDGGRRVRRRRPTPWRTSRRSAVFSRPSWGTTRSRSCSVRPESWLSFLRKQAAYITGRSFFPQLIEAPFASGLHLAFTFAAIATLIAIIASALRGKRYVHTAGGGGSTGRLRHRRDGKPAGRRRAGRGRDDWHGRRGRRASRAMTGRGRDTLTAPPAGAVADDAQERAAGYRRRGGEGRGVAACTPLLPADRPAHAVRLHPRRAAPVLGGGPGSRRQDPAAAGAPRPEPGRDCRRAARRGQAGRDQAGLSRRGHELRRTPGAGS